MEDSYKYLFKQFNQQVFDLLITHDFDSEQEQLGLPIIYEHASLFLNINKSIIDERIYSIIQANNTTPEILHNPPTEYLHTFINNSALYDLIINTRKRITNISIKKRVE